MSSYPVNPNASIMARQLLTYIYAIPPGRILTGQHNYPATLSTSSQRVFELTGKHPVVWGQDFGFTGGDDKDSILYRDRIIAEAIQQHYAGSVITLMWHAIRPVDDEPGEWKQNVQGTLSEKEYADLITPGTTIHARWLAQIDKIASYLKQLHEAGVPVLWRPYHEMNGSWFWWGKQSGTWFTALWRMLYQHFTDHHHLNNLIWVWNANALRSKDVIRPYPAMYPGDAYLDILATDIYGNDYRQNHYDDLSRLAGGKPVAIGECGEIPSPEIVRQQPGWAWFMTWTDLLESHNPNDRIRAIYHDPCVICRDDPVYGWLAWRTKAGTSG